MKHEKVSDTDYRILSFAIDKLIDHPENPNVMSPAVFRKLVRNIKRTGRYEPLVVRPARGRKGYFEIINGHHRRKALKQLGYKRAEAVVWDVSDTETRIFLATLNRLAGIDDLGKKLELLKKLRKRMKNGELVKFLPLRKADLDRLANKAKSVTQLCDEVEVFSHPMVFFLNEGQKRTLELSIETAMTAGHDDAQSGAQKRAQALTNIGRFFLEHGLGD